MLAALVLMSMWIGYVGPVSAADTIRIAYSSVNPHALLVSLAEKRGLFAKYGLSSVVVYIPGGSTVVQTMVSGDIDLGQLTGAPGVAANLRGDEDLRRQALASAQRALTISENQYRAGTVSYLEVVTAQSNVLSAETTLLTTRSQRLTALNTLLKNIGGRWAPISAGQPS